MRSERGSGERCRMDCHTSLMQRTWTDGLTRVPLRLICPGWCDASSALRTTRYNGSRCAAVKESASPGTTPAAACRRELNEELGLDRKPRRLLAVDWAPSVSEGDKLLFLFDCGELGQERITLNDRELDRWEWVEVAHIDRYVIDRIARRIRSTVTSGASYLEHGTAAASE